MKDSPVIEIIMLVYRVIVSYEIYLQAFGKVNKFDDMITSVRFLFII